MSRERRTKALILKKQSYGESDEIVTFFTSEFGKLRLLAKGAKKPTSRLQYSLQGFSEVEIRFQEGSSLPRLFQATPYQVFPGIYENEQKLFFLFWLAELMLKATPDEQPSNALYKLLSYYIRFLNQANIPELSMEVLKVKAILDFLLALGLGMRLEQEANGPLVFFSNSNGGFTSQKTLDGIAAPQDAAQLLHKLLHTPLSNIVVFTELPPRTVPLVQGFLHYQIERTINSERFLN